MAATVRVAALADLHCTKTSQGAFQPLFARIAESADILMMAGDLTDYGLPEEASVLVKELSALRIPVAAIVRKPLLRASILNTCPHLGHANGIGHTANFVPAICRRKLLQWLSPGSKPGGMDIAGLPYRNFSKKRERFQKRYERATNANGTAYWQA